MNREISKKICILIVTSLIFLLTACDNSLKNSIESHVVVFDETVIPTELIERLKDKKAVVVGEYHGIQEHKDFVTDLMLDLNNYNQFDQLLLEMSHSLGWILEDYTWGVLDQLPAYFQSLPQADISRIRDFNQRVPEEERIRVRAIDINHSPIFMGVSLRTMLEIGLIEYKEPVEEFLSVFDDNKGIIEDNKAFYKHVEEFYQNLIAEEANLTEVWGERYYHRILDIVEIEIQSIVCRKPLEEGNVQLRSQLREDFIKNMVDGYLKKNNNGTIINVGFYHAQNSHFLGTENKWLGEYLKHQSPYTNKKSYSLVVVPAKGEIKWGDTEYKTIDITRSGRRDELLRIMKDLAEERRAFLSLDDVLFLEKAIYINYHYTMLNIIPKEQFDGFVLLPRATRTKEF
ncbi:hypothetical protein HYG86_05950 [Alkalicella caledoniensis]|uniref:Erythromycin esterase n=1 Tax=Alkalicella caledoniensis TaxID=2731377 RepID=A0A7G9W6N6_ALKCA|nr:hypothetical protein [Alkalicella caledoniensis]QNO14348.1 hypothetical protein HYG86_05950 [Alkalicella caledoniensis]